MILLRRHIQKMILFYLFSFVCVDALFFVVGCFFTFVLMRRLFGAPSTSLFVTILLMFFTFILMREITENAVLLSRWNLQVIVASRSDWVTKYIVET